MNIQQKYYTRVIILQNLLDKITPVRGRTNSYSLRGTITQSERNAIVVGLHEIKNKLQSLRLAGVSPEKGADYGQDTN